MTTNTFGRRTRLSALVDVAQAALDDARAAGLHAVADQVDALRARAAELAISLWRGAGGGR